MSMTKSFYWQYQCKGEGTRDTHREHKRIGHRHDEHIEDYD